MSLADAFEKIFTLLPSLGGKNYSRSGAPEQLGIDYETIRNAYSDVTKVMGSGPIVSSRGFTTLQSKRTSATNGPIEFDHNVANPVHSHVPWIVIKYKQVFDTTTTDVYPVLLFDSSSHNSEKTNRVWLGLGMGVDGAEAASGLATRHEQMLSNFRTSMEDSMEGWSYGTPTQRGHPRLNGFLDHFICWKCYSGDLPDEVTLAEDVNNLLGEYLKFLNSGAKQLIHSQTSLSSESDVVNSSPWFWADKERMPEQVISLLLMENWLEKTKQGDYTFEDGMGYTNIAKNPKYTILRPKSNNLTPSSWKIYVNSNNGDGRNKSESFKSVVSIAAECAQNGTYTSTHSSNSDRAAIKAIVALLPNLFSFQSARTIEFTPNGSKIPRGKNKKKGENNMSQEERELKKLLTVTNNVVLEGVPGTGKTYIARKIADEMGENTRGNCTGKFAITMHPSTSYEDFVEGLRPNKGLENSTIHSPISVLLPHPENRSLRILAEFQSTSEPQCTVVSLEGNDIANPQEKLVMSEFLEKNTYSSSDKPQGILFSDGNVEGIEALSPSGDSKITPNEMYYFEHINAPEDAQFITEDGFFLRVCIDALQHPDKDVYVLVDEINRANVPKVLGDLLSTMEDSKRVRHSVADFNGRSINVWRLDLEPLTITLPYSKRAFFVPENIKIIATRNTTDRSVVPLDAALRRRFAFFRLEPERPKITLPKILPYLDVVFDDKGLNSFLMGEIGLDGLIGHSYFYDMKRSADPEIIWKYNVLPQLIDVLDGANLMDPSKIEKINEILKTTYYFLEISGVGLHQKITAKKLTDNV